MSDASSSSSKNSDEHDAGGAESETGEERRLWLDSSSSQLASSSSGGVASSSSAAVCGGLFSTPSAKRLFSVTPSSAPSSSSHPHRQSSTYSDCGSDLAKSMDDLTLSSLARLESKSEGTIRLQVPNLSSLRAKVNTSFHYIANLPWRLAAKTECSKRTSQMKFFSVYIDCNPDSESTLWSCDALVEFKLLSQKNEHHFSRHFTNKFNFNSNNWGFPSFIEWSDILSPEKGFVKHDRVVVEARITVHKVMGVRKKPRFDFLAPTVDVSDTALVINGVKLHISRQYLALYSPVFAAMFYGGFQEREKSEIPIEDVILEEFVELLDVVYPSHKPVSLDNVEYLLDLGDKFQIQFVIDECEKFLMTTEDIPVVTKLLWADQYCLAKLQDSCIRTFKTATEVKAVKASEEYKNLSDTTKAALLEKILKLI